PPSESRRRRWLSGRRRFASFVIAFPMRRILCPICASDVEWRVNDFRCTVGPRFSSKLGNSIKNAVYSVKPPSREPRKPSLAPYLWCPNCAAELEEYNDKQRRLKCGNCSLELPPWRTLSSWKSR